MQILTDPPIVGKPSTLKAALAEQFGLGGIPVAAALFDDEEADAAYLNCGPETRFEIGSITKSVTAILLCQAVQEGLCAFDDPIEGWLPPPIRAPRFRGRSVTLMNLATHTSGLPRLPLAYWGGAQPYETWSKDRLLKALSRTRIHRPPGSTYLYSNFGFAILGLLLENVYGRPYLNLVQDLTRSLGCPGLRLPIPGDERVNAQGHNALRQPAANWNMGAFAAAGACTATLPDMIAFAKANLAPDAPAFVREAFTHRQTFSTRPPFGAGAPRAVVFGILAGAVSAWLPNSYIVQEFCVAFATLAAGVYGGVLVTALWLIGCVLGHVGPSQLGSTALIGAIATGIMVVRLGLKRSQELGIGWHVAQLNGEDVIWHNGGTGGFRTFLGFQPATGRAVVVLAGQAKSVDALAMNLLKSERV